MDVGLDLLEIDRIKELIKKERFIYKVLTKKEMDLYKNIKPESLAGIFCSKEAFLKAIGTGIGRYGFQDISVLKDISGNPYLEVSNKIIEEFSIKKISLSITHTDKTAGAVVVLMYN